jgi:predicted DNA-binding transcriptional regulator AlpA
MPRFTALPPSLPPRGLSRVAAAEYIGVSPSKFDQLIADERMPPAKKIDGRVVWDLRQLDIYFDRLEDGSDTNPWDKALEG